MRLHQNRQKGDGRVRWRRPQRLAGWTEEFLGNLPEHIDIRLITFHTTTPGFRTRTITLATTLLDEEAFPDSELIALYRRRWEVENDFRDLKTSLGLDVLRTLTPEMIEREVLMLAIAYNLVRAIMHASPREKQNVYNHILLALAADQVPHRPDRSALRGDDIAPRLLGLRAIASEDCVRRALRRIEPDEGRDWLRRHLDQACHTFLDTKWVLDIHATIKPIYGRQEGASLGHNPHKPGRPEHAYHTYWIATLRLCLDVEVHPGKESAAGHGFEGLWALIDRLPLHRRPHLLRGDCACGQEALLCEAERRGLNYLCKLRRTAKARDLVAQLERATTTAWADAGQGWQGAEGFLRLQGWSQTRRVRSCAVASTTWATPGPAAVWCASRPATACC